MQVVIKLTRAEVEEILETRVRNRIVPKVIVDRHDAEVVAGKGDSASPVSLTMGFVSGVDQTKLAPGDYAYVISYWSEGT